MEQFTIISMESNQTTWDKAGAAVKKALDHAQGHYVEITFGLWVFQTHEAFRSMRMVEAALVRHNVPYVSIPLSEQLQCCVSKEIEDALVQLGVEIYNLAEI